MDKLCNTCIHKIVCSKYIACGEVKTCEHFKEERRGIVYGVTQEMNCAALVRSSLTTSVMGMINVQPVVKKRNAHITSQSAFAPWNWLFMVIGMEMAIVLLVERTFIKTWTQIYGVVMSHLTAPTVVQRWR